VRQEGGRLTPGGMGGCWRGDYDGWNQVRGYLYSITAAVISLDLWRERLGAKGVQGESQ